MGKCLAKGYPHKLLPGLMENNHIHIYLYFPILCSVTATTSTLSQCTCPDRLLTVSAFKTIFIKREAKRKDDMNPFQDTFLMADWTWGLTHILEYSGKSKINSFN